MILNSRGLTYLDFSLSDYQIYDCIDNKILDNTLNNLVLEIVRGRFRSEFIFITRTSHKCFRIYYNDELYTYHSYKDCIPKIIEILICYYTKILNNPYTVNRLEYQKRLDMLLASSYTIKNNTIGVTQNDKTKNLR